MLVHAALCAPRRDVDQRDFLFTTARCNINACYCFLAPAAAAAVFHVLASCAALDDDDKADTKSEALVLFVTPRPRCFVSSKHNTHLFNLLKQTKKDLLLKMSSIFG